MGTISLESAIEALDAANAAQAQAVRDMEQAVQEFLSRPDVDRHLDFARILTSLLPIRQRGLTETTRPNLNTAIEIARNAAGRT
jgi:hypothetical protein